MPVHSKKFNKIALAIVPKITTWPDNWYDLKKIVASFVDGSKKSINVISGLVGRNRYSKSLLRYQKLRKEKLEKIAKLKKKIFYG